MYRYSFYMSVCLLIFCLFAGPIMIDVLFGTQYESSLLLYNLLIFILITSSIGAVYTKVIYSVNLQARLLLRSITGIVINISLNYFLIKYYGVLGTAFATLISLFIIEIIYDFLDYKLRPFHIFKLKSILFIKSNH